MGLVKPVLAISSAVTAYLAYLVYTSVPRGIRNPWKMRLLAIFLKMQQFVFDTEELLGIDNWINLNRRHAAPRLKKLEYDLKHYVRARNEHYDGIPVRVYRPRNTSTPSNPLPVWVYFHGGGWIFGDLNMYDAFCRRVVLETGIAVVSVGYRLAPECKYPGPLDDCHKVAQYVLNNAQRLRFDDARVIVGGDSSGGNLAAAVALRMRNSNPPLAAQILIYPILQSLSYQLPSVCQPWALTLKRNRVPIYWLLYFTGSYKQAWVDAMLQDAHVTEKVRERYSKYVDYRKLPEGRRQGFEPKIGKVDEELASMLERYVTDPDLNPLISENLAGAPAALIVTGRYDVLRDEGTLYALRLKEAGIRVEHLDYEHGFHGMTFLIEKPLRFDVGVESFKAICKFIRTRMSAFRERSLTL